MYKCILLPTDNSPSSEHAAAVVRVLLEQEDRKAKHQKAFCTTQLTSTEPESLPGIAEALLNAGVVGGCDPAVMGSHGRNGLLLGSLVMDVAPQGRQPMEEPCIPAF